MSIEQTRPYELGDYDDTLDSSDIYVAVDYNNSWSRPKRYPLSSFGGGLKSASISHIESGRLAGLSNHYVEVTFDTAFSDIPVGRKNLHVYRVTDLGGGETVDMTVPFYGLGVTTTGFSFYIKSSESLTNVVIEYMFV